MRKIISLTLLFAFSWTILVQDFVAARPTVDSPESGAGKYSLAVLELEASGRVSVSDARRLTDRLRAELERAGMFQVMGKAQQEGALANSSINASGCSSTECALQAGKLLGTKLVAYGTVSMAGPLYFIQVQMAHVKSGEVVQNISEDFDGDFQALEDHMPMIVRKITGSASQSATSSSPATSGRTWESEGASNWEAAQSDPEQKSGNKALVIGLVAASVIGGGILISQALKDDDNPPPPASGNLPNPPTFP